MRRALALMVLLLVPGLARARETAEQREVASALEKARASAGPDGFAMASLHAAELAGDALGDPGDAHVGLQLPKREQECLEHKAKCWLVLYLTGFDSSAESFQKQLAAGVRELDARPNAAPIVVVILDGRTKLGGGWYVDSRTSGKWESFIVDALLPAARDALAPGTPAERTLVMGHSMGGFGALHLGMKHPRLFHGVAAFNPAARIVDVADGALAKLDARNEAPDPEALVNDRGTGHFFERVLLSMGGAFAPDAKAPHGLPPLFDASKHPWRLLPAIRDSFARYDVAKHAQELEPLARVQIYAGRADALIPLPQLQALTDEVNGTKTGPAKAIGLDAGAPQSTGRAQVELVISDGSHTSHLAADLKQALESLAK